MSTPSTACRCVRPPIPTTPRSRRSAATAALRRSFSSTGRGVSVSIRMYGSVPATFSAAATASKAGTRFLCLPAGRCTATAFPTIPTSVIPFLSIRPAFAATIPWVVTTANSTSLRRGATGMSRCISGASIRLITSGSTVNMSVTPRIRRCHPSSTRLRSCAKGATASPCRSANGPTAVTSKMPTIGAWRASTAKFS